jgi:peroxiredoxin
MALLVAWIVIGAICLVLLGFWAVLQQITGQQGRILVRLESLEQSLGPLLQGTHVGGHNGHAPPHGLSIGEELPHFELPELSGRTVGLRDFRGKRLLLVHWNPSCSFCSDIASELSDLQSDLRKRAVQLVLVSHGDADSNQRLADEHGLDCPILIQEQSQSVEVFSTLGTPAAYLVDQEGRVAAPLALGAEEVPTLAREAASGKPRIRLRGERPLSQSRIEREGLKAGTTAPSFSLPDLDGTTVSLDDYRGRRLLLVFSDSQCGPCDALLPELVRLQRQQGDDGLALVMVGRGDPEENRRKVAQHGIEFPVVVQPHWDLSRKYGIFASPVAFLVDEQGVIARDVAKGAEEIVTMVKSVSTAER